MPTSKDKSLYAILDYIAQTVGDEDDFQQNKRVKNQFARASDESDEAQTAATHREGEAGEHHTTLATGTTDNP